MVNVTKIVVICKKEEISLGKSYMLKILNYFKLNFKCFMLVSNKIVDF